MLLSFLLLGGVKWALEWELTSTEDANSKLNKNDNLNETFNLKHLFSLLK